MHVSDLTDEDIGRMLWVCPAGDESWVRVCFEGVVRKPSETLSSRPAAEAAKNGGSPYFVILKCSPQPGLTHFRVDGAHRPPICGLLIRTEAEVFPVNVVWAVTHEGEIIEIGETAA